jgi:predicted phosphate transport protein (TIGR00153 family)
VDKDMPKRPIFSQLFARSPISPIQDHMSVAVAAAAEMPAFFEAVLSEDWDLVDQIFSKISIMESEADTIKRNIRSNLPRSIFMPVSRSDILELLQYQDRIPNRCQDVAGLCAGRQMKIPAPLGEQMRAFVQSTTATVAFAGKALNELDELLETGFSGSEVELIEQMISDLNQAEHDTDTHQRDVQRTLFSIEQDVNPVDVMFLYRMIESLGDIADYAQSVGNRMLYLIAK